MNYKNTFKIVMIAAMSCTAGCGAIGKHHGLDHVSGALRTRTGHALPVQPAAPPRVNAADGVDEDLAITLALASNAAFQEALAETGITSADLELARQIPNPVLTLFFPLGKKQFEATARQILDAVRFRARRVKIAELESLRVAERLVQTGLDLIRDVRVAFVELALAGDREVLAIQAGEVQRDLAGLMERRVESGDASRLELAQAQTEHGRLSEEVVRQRTAASLARTRLLVLLGRGQEPGLELRTPSAPIHVPADVEALVARALLARPDAHAAEIAVQVAGERAGLARKEWQSLTAVVDLNAPPDGVEIGPGVDVALPINNRNEAGRARAHAELARAVRQHRAVRDRIVREVREAHARATLAAELTRTLADRTLPAAVKSEERAAVAHRLGESSLFVVLDARRQLVEARLRAREALAEQARAAAELERSVGERLTAPRSERRAD